MRGESGGMRRGVLLLPVPVLRENSVPNGRSVGGATVRASIATLSRACVDSRTDKWWR